MIERIRIHQRTSRDPSGLIPEIGAKNKRNFIDPIFLEASQSTSYADALTALGIGVGTGFAAAGIGLGTLFYQRGRADEIRATKQVTDQGRITKTPRAIPETPADPK